MSLCPVSVIVTNFNKGKYIAQCIESILSSSLQDIELIIVDDGSCDESRAIIRRYIERYPEIKYIEQPNKGVSNARNRGLSYAFGEYVTFVDADDYVNPDAYLILYQLGKENNADTVIGNIKLFDQSGIRPLSYMNSLFTKDGGVDIRHIKNNPELNLTPSVCNKLFKRELLVNGNVLFDEELSIGEDLLFTQRCLYLSNKTVLKNTDTVYYRSIQESERLSKQKGIEYFRELLKLQQKIVSLYEELDIKTYIHAIEHRQFKFLLDSIALKGIHLSEHEMIELFNVVRKFRNTLVNCKPTEVLDNKYISLIHALEKEDLQCLKEYINQHLHLVHRIELVRQVGTKIMLGGYAFIRQLPTVGCIKKLVFRSVNTVKEIKLKNTLRTDVTFMFSRNSIDYNEAGFETVTFDLTELPQGDWDLFINIQIEDVSLEKPIEIPLAQLRNEIKPIINSIVEIVPHYRSNRYLTFKVKKARYWSKSFHLMRSLIGEIRYGVSLLISGNFQAVACIILYKLFKTPFQKKNIWLIGERKDTAQDNSYHLFQYIRSKHPEINAYYVIDKRSKDYERVKKFGNIINYGSLRHTFFLLVCSKSINSYLESANMYTGAYKKIIKFYPKWRTNHRVFLQHGVIGVSRVNHSLHKNRSGYSLFIVSSQFEKEHVIKEFGYSDEEVVVSGLARWDALKDISKGNEILLMPTWRNWIKTPEQLKNSNYYHTYMSLLANKKLHDLLDRYDLRLTFYPHYKVQQLLGELPFFHDRIHIVRQGEETVQGLLKRHRLLITDYSTVSYDFAFMRKPVIFFQFDYAEFYSLHYNAGPINHKEELFGEVLETTEQLLDEMNRHILQKEFPKLSRADRFIIRFTEDQAYSKKIVQQILKLPQYRKEFDQTYIARERGIEA